MFLDFSLYGISMLERILELFDASGLSDSTLCKKLSFGNGTIGKWRSNKQKPSLDAVIKIAEYFNVSIDYIVYGTMFTDNNTAISPEDIEFLTLIHRLPSNKQYEFKGELKGYLKALTEFSS